MGEYQHSIDDKGRLIIPSKFREALGSSFVTTRGLDNCLFVYPVSEWQVMEQKLKSLPLMKSDARAFTRFFFSGATEGERQILIVAVERFVFAIARRPQLRLQRQLLLLLLLLLLPNLRLPLPLPLPPSY